MAITIRQLRGDLEALLAAYLGTYTLGNGTVVPAVSVRADSESIDAGTKVAGLELVVARYPSHDPAQQYVRNTTVYEWDAWLVEWDHGTQIQAAVDSIVYNYPGTTAQTILLPEGWGPKRQIQLTIVDPKDLPLDQAAINGGDFGTGLPASFAYAILDGGDFELGATEDTWTEFADGGVFT